MFYTLMLFAQEATQAATNPGGPGGQANSAPWWTTLLPLVAIGILFYFLMLRPMRRQEAERKALTETLKKNDKVLTSAGIYGTVISVSDTEDEVVVKVDDNTRVRMIKSSIARNLTNEEAAKAQKEATK